MAEQDGIYKCNVCGNVVSVLEGHMGELVCCEKPMEMQKAKGKAEEGKEKHVPVMEVEGNKVTVKVGSVEHPMEEKHFIEMVQLTREGKVIAEKRLKPGMKPEVSFWLKDTAGIKAREYCNMHGLWMN